MNEFRAQGLHGGRAAEVYRGQFDVPTDPLQITIPRSEIIAEMRIRGEDDALEDVCVAVAVVVDALEMARATTRS